ncbi:MAG: hypothetical protein ACOC2W_03205 [bacterium]
MKIFKLDPDYLNYQLPKSIGSDYSISDIYYNDKSKKEKMFAIINMVHDTEGKCDIMSWGYNGIGVNGNYHNYDNFLVLGNYLFYGIKNYSDIKLSRRYYKIIKLREKI